MMCLPFQNTMRAVMRMTERDREICAMVFDTSEQPVLKAMAADLRAVNAIDAAHLAVWQQELLEEHSERMRALEKDLPSLPSWSEASQSSEGLERRDD